MNYQYIVHEHGEEFPRDAANFGSPWDPDDDLEYIAEDAAENEWHNRDGWESSWPLTFEIFHEGKSLGRCLVEMESVPQFSARRQG